MQYNLTFKFKKGKKDTEFNYRKQENNDKIKDPHVSINESSSTYKNQYEIIEVKKKDEEKKDQATPSSNRDSDFEESNNSEKKNIKNKVDDDSSKFKISHEQNINSMPSSSSRNTPRENNSTKFTPINAVNSFCSRFGTSLISLSTLFWTQFCVQFYFYIGKELVHLQLQQFILSTTIAFVIVGIIYFGILYFANHCTDNENNLYKKCFFAILTLFYVLPFVLFYFLDPKFPFIQIEIGFLVASCLVSAFAILFIGFLIKTLCCCWKKTDGSKPGVANENK